MATGRVLAAKSQPDFSLVNMGDKLRAVFIPEALRKKLYTKSLLQARYKKALVHKFDTDSRQLTNVHKKARQIKSCKALNKNVWPVFIISGNGYQSRVIIGAAGYKLVFDRIAASFLSQFLESGGYNNKRGVRWWTDKPDL